MSDYRRNIQCLDSQLSTTYSRLIGSYIRKIKTKLLIVMKLNPDCDSGCRGFNPHRSPHYIKGYRVSNHFGKPLSEYAIPNIQPVFPSSSVARLPDSLSCAPAFGVRV